VAQKQFIEAADFEGETLITYPVDRERLDIFSQLLMPAGIEPKTIRQVELTAVILLLVASNRGVAVLPDWVVRERRLYAATRTDDTNLPFMAHLIRLARQEAVKLQRH